MFHGGPNTYFGPVTQCFSELESAGLFSTHGTRTVVVSDENLRATEHYLESINWLSCRVNELEQIIIRAAEPTEESIQEAYNRLPLEATLILGYGGGSVKDTAKALAAMQSTDLPVKDLYADQGRICRTARLVLIPTTAGTGSEASPVAVYITAGEKVALYSYKIRSDVAIIDPALALTSPRRTTESSGVDALTNALESSVSKNASFASSVMSPPAVARIHRGLREILSSSQPSEDSYYSICQGILLSTVSYGYGGCGGIHALAYPLSGRYEVRHGEANAVMLLPVLSYNMAKSPETARVAASALGIHTSGACPERAAEKVLVAIAGLLDLTSLPRTLQAIGVEEREIGALAAQTGRAHLLLPNNPVDISPSTANGLYRLAFSGDVYRGQF